MRMPSSVFAVGRYALVLGILAGSAVLLSAQRKPSSRSTTKRTTRPRRSWSTSSQGSLFSVVSAKIASDGTISVDYKLTDPQGLPLDVAGVQTPGPISPRFLVAYIPKGQTQFASYIVTTVTAVTGGATATQAAGDSGGTTTTGSRRRIHLYL